MTVGSSGEPTASATSYAVEAENLHGDAATITARASMLALDGLAGSGELLPAPADLLAAAVVACILKTPIGFSTILPLRYQRACRRANGRVWVSTAADSRGVATRAVLTASSR